MPRCTEIAVAVVRHERRVLIGPRPVDDEGHERWEFPGGKIEPDESPEDAAARECLEETGIAIDVGKRYAIVEHEYPTGRVRLHFFDAAPRAPVPQPRGPFRWVERSALDEYAFLEANAAVLRQLKLPETTV